MAEDFITECDGNFLRITINHPEEGNAMTDGMAAEEVAADLVKQLSS